MGQRRLIQDIQEEPLTPEALQEALNGRFLTDSGRELATQALRK